MNVEREINVWDPLLRMFHWGLVLFFSISYLTAEDDSIIHPWSGYAIVGLLFFRLLWGVIGPRHARFKDFMFSRQETVGYAKGLLRGDAKRYIGHNPLGGAMVFALLFSLMATTLTGMMVYGIEEGKGPLAAVMTAETQIVMPSVIATAQADDDEHDKKHDDESEMLEEIHEFFANFTVLLVMVHLIGVFFESVYHRESLVTAMLNGKKRVVDSESSEKYRPTRV